MFPSASPNDQKIPSLSCCSEPDLNLPVNIFGGFNIISIGVFVLDGIGRLRGGSPEDRAWKRLWSQTTLGRGMFPS